jgi:hypothetical protein
VKKLIAIFLLTVYTVTAFGVAINYHYCNNHLTQVTFLTFGGKSGCPCHQDAVSKGCCKDVMLYKIADNHKTSQEAYTINTISFTSCLPPVNDLHNQALQGGNYISDIFSDNVRRSCLRPIYILIRVFRI